MKTITYKYDDMRRAVELINCLPFCGIKQARIIAEIGNILDSGTEGKIMNVKGEDDNGLQSQKVCSD